MAEPTLSLALSDIQTKLATFAGWPTVQASQTPYQQSVITDACQSGLRRFYYPGRIEGETSSYNWSFLRPTINLALAANAQTIPLPDDYGSFEGRVTVLTAVVTSMPWRIEWRNESQIRAMYSATPTITGPPMFVAEKVLRGTGPEQGQRFQLFVFPTADQAYTLQVQYYLNPDYLTGATPYAYGGPQHIETILESCLAVMEERLDDMRGPHYLAFQERLAASIDIDRRKKAQSLGYNDDRSDSRNNMHRGDIHNYPQAATYNGQSFT